ncbi:MAG: reductive dehalogenase [bacterium]|nr:reductive dehalogenase [bacterium]
MLKNNIDRRLFLKQVGLTSAVLASGLSTAKVIARTADGVLVSSEEEYGQFPVEKLDFGNIPYDIDRDVLRQMSEKRNVFSRNVWDPERKDKPEDNVAHENLVVGEGKVPDQTRLDYALMAASWKYANMDYGGVYDWDLRGGMVTGLGLDGMETWDPAELDMTWDVASTAVKHAAMFYGASVAGIAKMNPLWLYSDRFSPERDNRARALPVTSDGDKFGLIDDAWYVPESMDRVIALAFEEDYFGIANSPGRLASAAVGNGYSRMAITSSTLADFIRALGYRAIPAGNGVGLSIPIAVDAGLGEIGRNGILINPKYGPRVRLAKVITDMPLIPDSPIKFGVTEFCEDCMLCADDCPSRSIPEGPRTWKGTSVSNNPGILKWYIHPETCYDFNGFSCSNCKRVCPFNKPNNSWLHKMIRQFIDIKVGPMNKAMVSLDQASGYGEKIKDADFWKMDGLKSITSREKM